MFMPNSAKNDIPKTNAKNLQTYARGLYPVPNTQYSAWKWSNHTMTYLFNYVRLDKFINHQGSHRLLQQLAMVIYLELGEEHPEPM